jgi:rare lipoprotein A
MKKTFCAMLLVAALAVSAMAQTPGGSLIFRQEGIASFYGDEFNGRPTASGEIYDGTKYTAAHPSLPFGTLLQVTNLANNHQVTVRVNDRGPFVASRIIDLSKAAAEALGMLNTGTAKVEIETVPSPVNATATTSQPLSPTTDYVVGDTGASATPAAPPLSTPPEATPAPAYVDDSSFPKATAPLYTADAAAVPVTTPQYNPPDTAAPPPPTATPPVPTTVPPVSYPAPMPAPAPQVQTPGGPATIIGGIPPAGNGKKYSLQVGSFKTPRNAVNVFQRLRSAGLKPAYERNQDYYRVILPNLRSDDISGIAVKLGKAGFREAVLHLEK